MKPTKVGLFTLQKLVTTTDEGFTTVVLVSVVWFLGFGVVLFCFVFEMVYQHTTVCNDGVADM